jgi:dienelactone hydrolase
MNAVARFTIAVLLVAMLTGCATPSQILPSPTATLQPTLPSPTATQLPPEPPFTNILVYDPPEMYKVIVETVQYPTLGDPSKTLPMDVFYPPDRRPAELLPAVVLVNGFPYSLEYGSRTFGSLPSWGRLIASYGLIAVAYETHNASDLEAVIGYIQQKGPDLGIDGSRLGFWSMSSHGGLASSFAFQENREYLKFAVFYYAWIMTPDNFMREEENTACVQYGCLGAELPDVKRLRNDLPVLVVRCGEDSAVGIAEADHFAQLATEAGVPLTLINFDEGSHTFDWRDTSVFGDVKDRAIEIIQQTLEFMKTHASDP